LAPLAIERKGPKASLAKPMLAAATDKAPECRAMAAYLLAQVVGHDEILVKLAEDTSAWVRFHAALSQLTRREAKAVPTLLALLGGESVELAWRADEVLSRLADEKGTGITAADFTDHASRKKYRDDWEKWWKANESKVNLAKVNLAEAAMGLFITCEIDGLG